MLGSIRKNLVLNTLGIDKKCNFKKASTPLWKGNVLWQYLRKHSHTYFPFQCYLLCSSRLILNSIHHFDGKKTGLIICGTYYLFIRCLGDNDTRYTDGFHKFHPSFYTGSKKATRSERGSIQTHYRKTKHSFRVKHFIF